MMMTATRHWLLGPLLCTGLASAGWTQTFEAVMPDGNVTAKMEVHEGRLLIRQQNGPSFLYEREPQFDSVDGSFIGYFHPKLNRVLRMPRSGNGSMMMADLDDVHPRYQASNFVTRPVAVASPPDRLREEGAAHLGQALQRRPNQGFRPGAGNRPNNQPRQGDGKWHAQPPHFARGQGRAYRHQNGYGHHGFVPIYTPNVYWLNPLPGFWPGGSFYSSNVYGHGYYGGFFSGTVLNVGNVYANPSPMFSPRFAPQSVVVDTRVVPGTPLPPVKLGLRNGSDRELIVTILDTKAGGQPHQIRIPAGGVSEQTFERDSTDKRIQTYETILPNGEYDEHQVTTLLPPAVRYELVVHTRQIQSIAIDRTGKSPNVIEDVNYQGKGVGRFTLPPGDQLRSATIDVYRVARSRNQPPGMIEPLLDPTMFD
ncbi:hypothetical protein [Novipirellula aureliae]|nr:hypothetical protein [Novipirellula aureliae]